MRVVLAASWCGTYLRECYGWASSRSVASLVVAFGPQRQLCRNTIGTFSNWTTMVLVRRAL